MSFVIWTFNDYQDYCNLCKKHKVPPLRYKEWKAAFEESKKHLNRMGMAKDSLISFQR